MHDHGADKARLCDELHMTDELLDERMEEIRRLLEQRGHVQRELEACSCGEGAPVDQPGRRHPMLWLAWHILDLEVSASGSARSRSVGRLEQLIHHARHAGRRSILKMDRTQGPLPAA